MSAAVATKLATGMSKTAQERYERCGNVPPTAILTDGQHRSIVATPVEDANPVDAFLPLLRLLAAGFYGDLRFIVVVAESWVKSYDVADRDPDTLRRGELQERHDEGDDTVRTAIFTTCLDARHPRRSAHVTAINRGPDTEPDWEVKAWQGIGSGRLWDHMTFAVKPLPFPPPPDVPLERFCKTAINLGLAREAVVGSVDDEGVIQ